MELTRLRPRERRSPTPLRVLGRGALAGYAGMAAMAVVVKAVQAVQSGGQEQPDDWEDAEPPAKFAHRFIEGVALRSVSIEHAGLLNNAMHLVYAPWLGCAYGVVQESVKARAATHGLAFGAAVWAARLTINPALHLKKPFWHETAQRNVVDATFHLAFGLGVAYAYRAAAARDV